MSPDVAGDAEHVRAHPWYVFGKSSGAKNPFLVTRPLADPAARAFNADEPVDSEAYLPDLLGQVGREMEVGGRKPVVDVFGVAVLPFAEVSLDDLDEPRVVEEAAYHSVDQRRIARDSHSHDDTADTDNAPSFSEGLQTFAPLGQVIERAKQKHSIDALVLEMREVACVANLCLKRCVCLF